MSEKIDQLWDAVFNHIPGQFKWLNIKINFILVLIGLVLALVATSFVITLR